MVPPEDVSDLAGAGGYLPGSKVSSARHVHVTAGATPPEEALTLTSDRAAHREASAVLVWTAAALVVLGRSAFWGSPR